MTKCFGIVSYLPEEDRRQARSRRMERLTNLLKQLEQLWPTVDILIIAQNWKDYQLPEIKNKIVVDSYSNALGIVGARNKLRLKFLDSDYDYLILLDDDAHIYCKSAEVANQYMEEIDKHKDGFCFIQDPFNRHWHEMDEYIQAPLNLCAISKYICAQEEIPNTRLEYNEALEDDIYAVLLHIKYPENEFIPPDNIYCDHFVPNQYMLSYTCPDQVWPSTWFKNTKSQMSVIFSNTKTILDFIVIHKRLPNITKTFSGTIWIDE